MQEKLATLLRDRLGISGLAAIPNRHDREGYSLVCKGADAVELWKKLRALADESGYWPVILGNDKEVGRMLGVLDSEDSTSMNKFLYQVPTETADGWLRERREANLQGFKDGYGDGWREAQAELHGEWPATPDPLTSFTIPLEHGRQRLPMPKVTIGLFPVKDGWQVPAYLNFGGWNECPDPVGHFLMMRKWHEKYGAELVGMNGDVIEMFVPRPPGSREEALVLAEEQYLYCEDIVVQGTQTIESLAAGLLGNHIWFFWWD